MPTAADIQSLPVELLRRVFFFHCSSSATNVWTLCAISKLWREIAVAYPYLWGHITINIYTKRPAQPVLDLLLTRSANSPLDIEITDGIGTDPALGDVSFSDFLTRMMNILSLHIHKWRSFILDIEDWERIGHCDVAFRKIPFDQAIKLERLILDTMTEGRWFLPNIGMIPALKHLEWKSTIEVPDPIITQYRISWWNQLVHLRLDLEQDWALYDVIRQCIALETLVVERPSPHEDFSQSEAPITLPRLRTLSLRSSSREGLDIFSILHCSNLNVLHLHIEGGWPGEHERPSCYNTLLSFLAGSDHAIQVLQLKATDTLFPSDFPVELFKICQAAAIPIVELVTQDDTPLDDILTKINQVLVREGDGEQAERQYVIGFDCGEDRKVRLGWVDVAWASPKYLEDFRSTTEFNICEIRPTWKFLVEDE